MPRAREQTGSIPDESGPENPNASTRSATFCGAAVAHKLAEAIDPAAGSEDLDPEQASRHPLRILLVEDNPGDVRLTIEALREGKLGGYDVVILDAPALLDETSEEAPGRRPLAEAIEGRPRDDIQEPRPAVRPSSTAMAAAINAACRLFAGGLDSPVSASRNVASTRAREMSEPSLATVHPGPVSEL